MADLRADLGLGLPVHEVDQLDGIFWLQRLSRLKRDRLVKKWEKAQG